MKRAVEGEIELERERGMKKKFKHNLFKFCSKNQKQIKKNIYIYIKIFFGERGGNYIEIIMTKVSKIMERGRERERMRGGENENETKRNRMKKINKQRHNNYDDENNKRTLGFVQVPHEFFVLLFCLCCCGIRQTTTTKTMKPTTSKFSLLPLFYFFFF